MKLWLDVYHLTTKLYIDIGLDLRSWTLPISITGYYYNKNDCGFYIETLCFYFNISMRKSN